MKEVGQEGAMQVRVQMATRWELREVLPLFDGHRSSILLEEAQHMVVAGRVQGPRPCWRGSV